ncbi:MAG: hypothetical protein Q6353_005775 [Candidatus Sigynarchaeum springense]
MVNDADYEAIRHHYDANYCMPWLDAWRERVKKHDALATKTCPDPHVPVIAFELPLALVFGSGVPPENITKISHASADNAIAGEKKKKQRRLAMNHQRRPRSTKRTFKREDFLRAV